MKQRLHILHRYLGLLLALFWLLQAGSGVLIGFRSEIDDWQLGQAASKVDPARLGQRLEAVQAGGSSISSVWASGGVPGQFDIYLADARGVDRTIRVDGSGQIIRDRPDAELFTKGAMFETLTAFHQTLLLGDTGTLIVGFSGILLLTNILLGLRLAWRRRIIASLFRRPAGTGPARLLGWHRLVGLWFAIPAMVMVTAGVLLSFEHEVESAIGGSIPGPEAPPAGNATTGPGAAIATALARYPGADLTAITMPEPDAPWYRVRVRAPGEMPRKYGASTVHVSTGDGAVLLDHDARGSRPQRRFMETLYPLHTGQIGNLAGRLVNFAVGLWLIAMIVLGLLIWGRRRPSSRGGASA